MASQSSRRQKLFNVVSIPHNPIPNCISGSMFSTLSNWPFQAGTHSLDEWWCVLGNSQALIFLLLIYLQFDRVNKTSLDKSYFRHYARQFGPERHYLVTLENICVFECVSWLQTVHSTWLLGASQAASSLIPCLLILWSFSQGSRSDLVWHRISPTVMSNNIPKNSVPVLCSDILSALDALSYLILKVILCGT